MSIRLARVAARKMLEGHGMTGPWIDVMEVCRRLNFIVLSESLGEARGVLIRQNGRVHLGINTDNTKAPDRRMSIARLIAHETLRHEIPDGGVVLPDFGHTAIGGSQVEREASAFALELLMPHAALVREAGGPPILDATLERLARTFEVPAWAVMSRLGYLLVTANEATSSAQVVEGGKPTTKPGESE